MTHSARPLPVAIALLSTLVLAPTAPEAGNILLLIAGGVGVMLMWPEALLTLRRPIVWMPLIGLLLLAIAYVIGERSLGGLVGLMFFIPLFAIWPLVTLSRLHVTPAFPTVIATMSLGGVAAACVIAISEVLTTGTMRAGLWVANPIHFADVALLVGYVSLAGLLLGSGWSRLVFLLGPVAATIAVVLSGTRGAIIADAAMVGIALFVATTVRLITWKQFALLVAGVTALFSIALLSGGGAVSAVQRIVVDVTDLATKGFPQDESIGERVQMYTGAFRAFLDSPIIGQGPTDFVRIAMELAGSSLSPPHLHNDLAGFAASAGIFGILAYGLFVLAPLVELKDMPSSGAKGPIVVFAACLIGGYIIMGLTNVMFGILTVTCSFVAISVCISMLRDWALHTTQP